MFDCHWLPVIPIKQRKKERKKNNEEGQDQPVFAQAIKYSNAIFRPKVTTKL